eukprot:11504-Heterococcus_DN1.PRE.3
MASLQFVQRSTAVPVLTSLKGPSATSQSLTEESPSSYDIEVHVKSSVVVTMCSHAAAVPMLVGKRADCIYGDC